MRADMDDRPTFDPDTSSPPGISIILPAWNEVQVIATAISEADEALRRLTDHYEIIVVDDGSSDETSAVVMSIASRNPRVRLIQHANNLGYGAALRSGFSAATNPLVAFTDADCQFNLRELDRLVLLSSDYDVVCGYRIDRQDSALRCLYSRGYNLLVRRLLGTQVRDVDCAFKLFRRSVVQDLEITTDGFLVNSELLTQAKQRGYSIVEVGVSHRPRVAGESTVSASHIPNVFASLLKYWWNHVQFPARGGEVREVSPPHRRKLGQQQLLLIIVAACFLFLNLGYPLIDRDETRYAEIPREMLVTGNWIIPQLNFRPYYDKPPLVYWLCAISYQLFGVSERSARLVPAVAALSTLAVTIWFGNRWFGRRIGLYSGLVLVLSAGFLFCSRYLLLDGVLTALVATSLMTAFEAMRGERIRSRWWLASAVLCGLAFLTKGPLAIVLWLPPVALYGYLADSKARPSWSDYARFAGVVLLIVTPWLLMVSLQDDRYLYEFFVTHNIKRFAGEMHTRPLWYYVPVLLLAGHPWSSLVFPLGRFITGRSNELRSRRPPALGYLVLWAGWVFLFFSLSRCKLATYLLPSAPALALVMGNYLHVVLDDLNPRCCQFARRWSPKLSAIGTCVAALGFLCFAMYSEPSSSLTIYAWALFWTGMLTVTVLLIREPSSPRSAWKSSALIAGAFSLMVMHHLLPAYSRSQTLFGAGSPFAGKDFSQSHIATVSHEFSAVPFYLNRSDIPHWTHPDLDELTDFVGQRQEAIIVVRDRATIAQLQRLLSRRASVEFIGRRGPAHVVRVRTPSRIARSPSISVRPH